MDSPRANQSEKQPAGSIHHTGDGVEAGNRVYEDINEALSNVQLPAPTLAPSGAARSPATFTIDVAHAH